MTRPLALREQITPLGIGIISYGSSRGSIMLWSAVAAARDTIGETSFFRFDFAAAIIAAVESVGAGVDACDAGEGKTIVERMYSSSSLSTSIAPITP